MRSLYLFLFLLVAPVAHAENATEVALRKIVLQMGHCMMYFEQSNAMVSFYDDNAAYVSVKYFGASSENGYGYGYGGSSDGYGYGYGEDNDSENGYGYGYSAGRDDNAIGTTTERNFWGRWHIQGDKLFLTSDFTGQISRSLLIAPRKRICSYN